MLDSKPLLKFKGFMMFIKKLAVAAVIATLGVSTAFARAPKQKAYLGVDLQGNRLTLANGLERLKDNGSEFFKTKRSGVSAFAGYRWDELGLELGYTFIHYTKYTGIYTDGRSSVTGELSQLDQNVYLDAIYYYPLTNDLDLKALLGVGSLMTTFKGSLTVNDSGFIARGSDSHTESKAGIRVGLGAQYYFTDSFSSNLMLKFQTGNDIYKHMTTLGLGFAVHF
jgi:opacity protein-like surface antigen